MWKATFRGDPRAPDTSPQELRFGERVFPRGQAVDLDDPALARKLRHHPEFEIEGDEPVEIEPASPQSSFLAAWNAMSEAERGDAAEVVGLVPMPADKQSAFLTVWEAMEPGERAAALERVGATRETGDGGTGGSGAAGAAAARRERGDDGSAGGDDDAGADGRERAAKPGRQSHRPG